MTGRSDGIRRLNLNTSARREGAMGNFLQIGIGADDNPSRPSLVHIRMAAGQISPRHRHEGWACSIVLEGACTYDDDLYQVGDVLLAAGNAFYGPLVPGPDGVTILEIFEAQDRFAPDWEDPNHPQVIALNAGFGDNPPWKG